MNTTVRLISINWRQTCGFTIYAKQRRKPVEAANSEPYRLLMKAKQCAINLQADEKITLLSHLFQLYTNKPKYSNGPHPLYTHCIAHSALTSSSHLSSESEVGTQSTREKDTGKEICLKLILNSDRSFRTDGEWLGFLEARLQRDIGSLHPSSCRTVLGAFWQHG